MTNLASCSNFGEVRRASSFRSTILPVNASGSCSLNPIFTAETRPWAIGANRYQDFPISVSLTI